MFDHRNDLLTKENLEEDGWETVPIGNEKIQRPYYYAPGHRIADQIKSQTTFGPDSTISSSLDEIESLAGSGLMLQYTDSLTQVEYPGELGEFIYYFNHKDKNSERYGHNTNINKRFNVISMEFTKECFFDFLKNVIYIIAHTITLFEKNYQRPN